MERLSFTLKPKPPFRLDLTAWVLRRRPANAYDRWDGVVYRRIFYLSKPTEVRVRQRKVSLSVEASAARFESGDRPRLEAEVRRLLGLDIVLDDFYRLARRDKALRQVAERFRGVKPPRFPSLFETLVNGIACQQLTLDIGIDLLNRLSSTYGYRGSGGLAGFPRAERLAGAKIAELKSMGFSGSKAEAIIGIARESIAGRLEREDFERLDDAAAMERLLSLRGIGPWTAEYALLRALGRLHIYPGEDSGARRGMRRWLGLRRDFSYSAMRRRLRRWGPYPGLIYFHLLLNGLASKNFYAESVPLLDGPADSVLK